MRLRDKVAVVTGSGQGIGESIALKMAMEGAKVVVAEQNRQTGSRTRSKINEQGKEAVFHCVDVARKEAVEEMVREVLSRWKRIDILVNNAGFDRPAVLLKVTEEDWNAVHGIHLKGSLNCIQAVAPGMIERRYGKIVNISSIYAKSGGIAAISYGAAKAGLVGLTRCVARELGKYQINCNAVLPGLTMTPTIAKMPEKYQRMIIEQTPLQRYGRPEEIANVVAFLASDEASFITGAAIEVSGGWNM